MRLLLWLMATMAAALSALAYLQARRLSRRLEELTRSYWELRYQHGLLRSQVSRLDPEAPPVESPSPVAGYVPLSSLKTNKPRVVAD